MCAPTVLARAVTALNEEQSSFAHTVNVRRLPGLGGPAGSGVTVVGDGTAADRASAAAPAGPLRARWRRNPSNWTAASRGEDDAIIPWGTAGAAVRVVVPSRKGEDSPKVPATDCGTRRYSTESTAERFAANVTHPESAAGSSVVSPPIDSATWDASAEPHAGSAGAEVLEQPAAARKDHTTRCTALRRFMPTSALALPASCSGPDVHPQLHAAGPPHRRATKERALQEILVVEHVVDVELRPNHDVADRPGVPGAGAEDEARRYVV